MYSFETNKRHLICCAAHSGPLIGERKKSVVVLMVQHMKKEVITVLINVYAIDLQHFLLNDQGFNLL